MNGGQGDGRGGITADRLGQDVRSGDARNFAADGGGLFRIGDDPAIARRENGPEPGYGFAKQGIAAGDIEQLLGGAHAAAGPEASAAASGEEDGAVGESFNFFRRGHGNTRRAASDLVMPWLVQSAATAARSEGTKVRKIVVLDVGENSKRPRAAGIIQTWAGAKAADSADQRIEPEPSRMIQSSKCSGDDWEEMGAANCQRSVAK